MAMLLKKNAYNALANVKRALKPKINVQVVFQMLLLNYFCLVINVFRIAVYLGHFLVAFKALHVNHVFPLANLAQEKNLINV